MFLRAFLLGALYVASADAFAGGLPIASGRVALRSDAGAATGLKMVDWGSTESENKQQYGGVGADRGQINQSDKVGMTVEQRMAEARRIQEEKNIGSKSGLDPTGKLREGDRDPATGRLILDPLKIPTASQGAPGTWEEYMKMRKAKEGEVKDLFGNPIEGVKPTYQTQAGTWGPPKTETGDIIKDLFAKPTKEELKIDTQVDAEQEAWRQSKEAERAKQQAETEARMAKWMADAAAKKAAGGQ